MHSNKPVVWNKIPENVKKAPRLENLFSNSNSHHNNISVEPVPMMCFSVNIKKQ